MIWEKYPPLSPDATFCVKRRQESIKCLFSEIANTFYGVFNVYYVGVGVKIPWHMWRCADHW